MQLRALKVEAERKRGTSVLYCKDAERGILRSGICERWVLMLCTPVVDDKKYNKILI